MIFGFILTIHIIYDFLLSIFGSAHYIIRYRDIIPNARERIMTFSFRYYSFLPKFEFLKFCSKNGGSVKEILMIPTPIVTFLFASLCSFVWLFSSQFRRSYFKFAAICRHFFRAFLSLDPSRIFQALPFGSRLFFRNILSNILEALDRLLSVRHFVLSRTHLAPGIIDNFVYFALIRAYFYQLCH